MNGFACAVVQPFSSLLPELRARLATSIATQGNVTAELAADRFTAVASTEPEALRPLLARRGALLAAGDVRLDNRAEVAAWGGVHAGGLSDLELVLAAYAARGPSCLDGFLGDFALALWDGEHGTLTAMRDPFGVKRLFMSWEGDALVFSSRVSSLARPGTYDEEWIADFLVGAGTPPDRTVWAGVSAVAPGEVLTWRDGALSRRHFWSAASFTPAEAADQGTATEMFRALFEEAVRVRCEGGVPVWSQLSGGLDSSAVVCIAQMLAKAGRGPGLAGTVTLVEPLGDGDERRYSDKVVQRWGLLNKTLVPPWAWQDDGMPPQPTDEPQSHYPYWARDRAMVETVRHAGGRVLLSGQGSDQYLAGSWSFVTDLLRVGQVRTALEELTRLSVAARQSFWSGLGRYAIRPLLPTWLQLRLARPYEQLPAWLDAGFVRRLEVVERLPTVRQLAAPRGGSFFAHEVATDLALLPAFFERGPSEIGVEMRYPFLYRPLVEHSLRLPPLLRIHSGTPKYVLREAMRGILPEEVRSRRGKGGSDARLLWALNRERTRLDELLRDPEIAQRGWVNADALRAATEKARQGEVRNLPFLLCALSLETWLAVRSGRWTQGM